MAIEQEGRLCRISSPLGEDVLFVQELTCHEGMSEPFQCELTLVAETDDIDFARIIGQSVTVTIDLADDSQRFINGVVSRFSQEGSDGRLTTYRARVVPWLWLLTRRTDCRIFQEQNVEKIVAAVFDRLGFSNYEFKLNGTYDPMVYCVQYRETDFNFVSRLLEAAGIFYYFRHEESLHTLVLADSPSHNDEVPGQATAVIDPAPGAVQEQDHIERWRVDQVLQPGKYALTDYNFIDPGTELRVDTTSRIEVGNNAELEIYDYPGAYVNLGAETDGKLEKGDQRVLVRREEGDCQAVTHQGDGNCRAFVSGYRFDLEGHGRADYNITYLLTDVDHFLSQSGDLFSGSDVTSKYSNTFECIAHEVPFRPERRTEKPRVRGPQTAVVTGQSGEEIYTDDYGRIKVRFHWDRESAGDETSSCWIRVAQNLAGKEWGMQFRPRVGQEVVVDFLEGDPDRPLVTGRVYNAQQPIPYAEPTQSGIKTRSSKKGSPDNYNEIRFEDKKGSEELYFHAEKNETIIVETNKSESVGNDESVTIGNDRSEEVGNNETRTIGADRSVTVGANETLAVGADRSRQVGANETVTVAQARTHNVGVNEAISVGGAQEITVGADRQLTVGASQTLSVGSDLAESVGAGRSTEIGKDDTVEIGKKLSVKAGDEISIVTGKAKIVMKKDGTINIEGKDITLKGSGKITVKASKDVTIKGKKILNN